MERGEEMNAIKTRERLSKRAREDLNLRSATITQTMEFFMKLVALSLHEIYGFGEERFGRVAEDVMDKVDEYTERYDSECVITAIDKKLREAGIEICFVEREK